MTTPDFHAAGHAPRIVGSRSVVFTDRTTGRVHHVHTVVLCEGANAPADADLMREAARAARRLGQEVERLDAKMVSHPEERPQAGA